MVLIQRKEWGAVWFDELIRKDGLFLPKDLQPLNPKNLKKAQFFSNARNSFIAGERTLLFVDGRQRSINCSSSISTMAMVFLATS